MIAHLSVSPPLQKLTLAEQMAANIQEMIVSEVLPQGSNLPTEPDLAEQFGVSRAVVRDATRILMARGLVQVLHGRGVFVTQVDNFAFGEALMLVLKRSGASAWDVGEFEQILLPEIASLAAIKATNADLQRLQLSFDEYSLFISEFYHRWFKKDAPQSELEHLTRKYQHLMQTFFSLTHNKLIEQLAAPLNQLHNLRQWQDQPDDSPEQSSTAELAAMRLLVQAITQRDATLARTYAVHLLQLPLEAIRAMQATPIDEVSTIPIPRRVN